MRPESVLAWLETPWAKFLGPTAPGEVSPCCVPVSVPVCSLRSRGGGQVFGRPHLRAGSRSVFDADSESATLLGKGYDSNFQDPGSGDGTTPPLGIPPWDPPRGSPQGIPPGYPPRVSPPWIPPGDPPRGSPQGIPLFSAHLPPGQHHERLLRDALIFESASSVLQGYGLGSPTEPKAPPRKNEDN